MIAYRFDFVFESVVDVSDEDLVELGIEVKESITSFLKAKRYKMNLVGTIDLYKGNLDESTPADHTDAQPQKGAR